MSGAKRLSPPYVIQELYLDSYALLTLFKCHS